MGVKGLFTLIDNNAPAAKKDKTLADFSGKPCSSSIVFVKLSNIIGAFFQNEMISIVDKMYRIKLHANTMPKICVSSMRVADLHFVIAQMACIGTANTKKRR